MGGGDELVVFIADIAEVKVGGFFRKTLTVKTKNGSEYKFVGSVGRMGQILKFEIAAMSEKA